MLAHDFVGFLHIIGVFFSDTFGGIGHEIAAISAEALVHFRDRIAIAARVVGCIVEALLRAGRIVGKVIFDCSSAGCKAGRCEEKYEEL